MIVKLCLHCGRHYQPPGIRGRCKDCGRAYDQRHSVERRVRNSAKWQQARAAARQRDGERCTNCGSSERLQVHHIVPLAKGGKKFALSNLTTLCSNCHADVGGGRETNAGRVSSHPDAVTRERNAHAKKNRKSKTVIPERTSKRCTACSEWLPFSAFPRHKRMHEGLSSHCRKCHNAATQDWRERNREEINRARREAYGSSKPHRYPKARAPAGKAA